MDSQIKNLNLLLLYLTGWEEVALLDSSKKRFRSWKGYLYEILTELEKEGLITQCSGDKSVFFTKKGLKIAKYLKEKYLKED